MVRAAASFGTLWGAMLLSALLLVGACSVVGCGSLGEFADDNPALARASVQLAVVKFIDAEDSDEAESERARRTRDIASRLASSVEAGPDATLSEIAEAARSAIPWDDVDGSERVLINALIDTIKAEIAARIGDGVLKPDQRVRVARVLEWVAEAAGAHPSIDG